MTKRILVIEPDGTEREMRPDELGPNGLPTNPAMRLAVGGYIELVRVLRADITDRNVYTFMVVNEEGLLKRLPDNPKATAIYLANVERAYPDHSEPWRAAAEAHRRPWVERGAAYFDITPEPYKGKKPVIVGPVIWFDGYTCDELIGMGF